MSSLDQNKYGPWLHACVRQSAFRPAAALLATAAGAPEMGDGALLVFSMAGACLESPGQADEAPTQPWQDLAHDIAVAGMAASKVHSQIAEGSKSSRRQKVWGAMLRMADLYAQGDLVKGCRTAIGLVLALGLANRAPLTKKVVDQLSGMAGACVHGSGHEYAHEWVAFSQVNLLDVVELQKVVDGGAPEQIRSLAGVLQRAVSVLAAVPRPSSISYGVDVGLGAHSAGLTSTDGEDRNDQPGGADAAADAMTEKSGAKTRHKQVASVVGLSKSASFARTAHVFSVGDAWDRYAPFRLAKVTRAAAQALDPARRGLTRGFALLALMAMVISHDHRPAVRLRIGLKDGEKPDLWYCPVARCAFADRRLLLRLKTDDGTPDLIPLFVPGDVAREIEQHLQEKPEAHDLLELLGIQDLDGWLSQAEGWLAGLGDPAHKSRSARISHALGLVYRLVGATQAEAALLTLNLALAPDGALHYIAISPERAYELACRVFDFLQLQRPAPPPPGLRIGSRDVPTAEQMREDWAAQDRQARIGLEILRAGGSLDTRLAAFTQVMVAARRAHESLTGARHENMSMPRVADLLGSADEGYTDDKRTPPSSARLLTITPELRHVVAVVGEARALLVEGLRELGYADAQIPAPLLAWSPWAPFYYQIKRGGRRKQRRLTLRALDAKAFAKHERPWKGADNMGRHFWASAADRAQEEWAELLVCGHGRGLAHVGSSCLGRAVAALQAAAAGMVRRTLDELALPSFGGGTSPWLQPIAPTFDFGQLQRRMKGSRLVDSAPADMPAHHCDSHSTMTLPLARAWRAHVGGAEHLLDGATVLLALAVIDGLTYSPDIRSVWEPLRTAQGTFGALYVTVTRESGQRFELPLMPATRSALELAGSLPDWDVAEKALRAWLGAQWPSIRWPEARGAVLAAVCFIAARWVRLHQLPILVQAYRPEVHAACYDDVSNQRLKTGGAPIALGGAELRQLLQRLKRRTRSTRKTVLQEMLYQHGRISMSKARKGGPERRAKLLSAWFDRIYVAATLSPVAAMVLRWVQAECAQWAPLRPGRDRPSTIYKYLQRLLAALDRLPVGMDPATFGPAEWRQLGAALLDTSDVPNEADRPKAFRWRRIALGRLVSTLQTLPQYALARYATADQEAPPGSVARAVSAARVLVRPMDIEVAVAGLKRVYDDDALQALAAEARLRLAFDLRARADEINALELTDLAEDGSFVAIDTVGFTYRKTPLSMRFGRLSPPTREVLLKLRAALRTLRRPPKLFFSDRDGIEDLRHGYQQQVVVDSVMRRVLGHPGFEPHALRGNGFADGLCPGHADHIIAMLAGPLELVHARAIVTGLAGESVAHVAEQLNTTGHASDGVPVADYMTAWPWWYAAGMRVALADVPLTPGLAEQIPGCSRNGLATWRLRGARRGEVDEWCWAVRRHYPGWKWCAPAQPTEKPVAPVPRPLTSMAPEPVSVGQKLRYLVLRQLESVELDARNGAKLGDRAGEALEPLLLLLPGFAEVHERRNADEPSDRTRDSVVRLFDEPLGQSLFGHLTSAPNVASELLLHMLRGTAPPCSELRAREALNALPLALGLELAFGPGDACTKLAQIFEGSRRVVVTELSRPPASEPRVRVIEAAPLPINQCTAAHFTALARLSLESLHLLKQGVFDEQ